MKYTVEMGSSAMIYILIVSFMQTGLGIQKLMAEGFHRHTDKYGDRISLF
jgi:hypothetical protein